MGLAHLEKVSDTIQVGDRVEEIEALIQSYELEYYKDYAESPDGEVVKQRFSNPPSNHIVLVHNAGRGVFDRQRTILIIYFDEDWKMVRTSRLSD